MRHRFIILAVIAFTLISIFVCCGNGQASTYKEYTLCPGDTLWELHQQYGQAMPYQKWEYEMFKLNGKEYGSTWYVGEEILVEEVDMKNTKRKPLSAATDDGANEINLTTL